MTLVEPKVQIGFELNKTKNYATPESAVANTKKALRNLLENGVMFNIIVVSQRKGGNGTDAEDPRYIPLLCCWRAQPNRFPGGEFNARLSAARLGFVCFT